MPQTLRYSDFKGRTDLVGRKVRVPADSCLTNVKGEVLTIKEMTPHRLLIESAGTRRSVSFDQGTDCCKLELLDEEPDPNALTSTSIHNKIRDAEDVARSKNHPIRPVGTQEEPERSLHFVEYHGIDNESGKRPKVSLDNVFKDSKEGQTHSYNDGCGDPAHNGPAGTYEGAPMKGDPVPDTRTEITWENCTLEDMVSCGYKDSMYIGEIPVMTMRECLRKGMLIYELQQRPIKMTLSQIEEKLGHRVEIVD